MTIDVKTLRSIVLFFAAGGLLDGLHLDPGARPIAVWSRGFVHRGEGVGRIRDDQLGGRNGR
jgi:hypothetical protein